MFTRAAFGGTRVSATCYFATRHPIPRATLSTTAQVDSNMRAAVVLAGNGVYDGSEITEAVSTLVHLSRHGAIVKCFAPDKDQAHVVDHTKGEEMQPPRNVMVESARIARGDVTALSKLIVSDFDVLVIPGGFGAAKNLCDWAFKEIEMSLDVDVERIVKDFHRTKKPIAMCCIAPVIAAKTIPGVRITVGKFFDIFACGIGRFRAPNSR